MEVAMSKDKEQSRGRTENGAIPAWENQRDARKNTAEGRKPQPGQSTENAGTSAAGLGKAGR
jgi:hypothetical protein